MGVIDMFNVFRTKEYNSKNTVFKTVEEFYDKKETEYIKELIRDKKVDLEKFKAIVYPQIEMIQNQRGKIIPKILILKKEEMQKLQKGFQNGLTVTEVLSYKNRKMMPRADDIIHKIKEKVITVEDVNYLNSTYKSNIFTIINQKNKEELLQEKIKDLELATKICRWNNIRNQVDASLNIEDVKRVEDYLYNEQVENIKSEEKDILEEDKEKDTDGDGLNDFEEKNIYSTNERERDTDGDGKTDYAEVKIYKSNPCIVTGTGNKKTEKER